MLTLLAAALAADLPSIDQPLATGVNNTTDAAVVVGVGDYLRVQDVPYADADARAFAAFATSTLGIPESRIWQPRNKNKEAIEAAVTQAGAKVRTGGTVWVFFAGHGAADPKSKERLLLGDDVTDDAGFAARSVSVAKVEALAGAGGARVIVVSDVCYTGQFRSLVLDPPKPKGDVIEWSAAQQGQVAAPLAGTGHGAFTWMVLGAFRGWADGEPEVEGAARNKADGVVTAREARDYVERQLAAMQLRGQVPEMVAGGAGLESARLVSGVREAAPVLGVAGTTGGYTATPSTSGGFGDLSLNVDAQLKAQACDDDAKAKGQAGRDAKLMAAAKSPQAEAAAAWAKLGPQAEACTRLTGAAERDTCAKTVDGFVARASALVVTLPAGTEQVTTACGMRQPAFAAVSQRVRVAELSAARALAVKLRQRSSQAVAKAPEASRDWSSRTLGTMKWIPPGTFVMGSPETEAGRDGDETEHDVTLTKGFYLMEHEVTQGEWKAVMGTNPSKFPTCGDDCPMENVSWDDVEAFAKKVSARDGVTYRLPTDAEWEFAARGGETFRWAGSSEVDEVAWYEDNSGGTTHEVCTKSRNGYGLCDMSGNVWEWTSDWYGAYIGAVTDPTGAPSGSGRDSRGGSWSRGPSDARVARRYRHAPGGRGGAIGFRLARTLP